MEFNELTAAFITKSYGAAQKYGLRVYLKIGLAANRARHKAWTRAYVRAGLMCPIQR